METTLIKNARYVLIAPGSPILEGGAVLVKGNRIKKVGATSELETEYQVDTIINACDKIVMPGLVDAHNHLGNWNACTAAGLRGEGIPRNLLEALYEVVHPAYTWMPEEAVYDIEMVGYLNMIKTGTTTVSDAFMFPDESGRAAVDSGLRVDLCPHLVTSWRSPDSEGPERDLRRTEDAIQKWHGAANGRITYRVHPSNIYMCRDWFLKECVALAKKCDVGISVHAAENQIVVELARAVNPKGDIERAHELGLMGPKSIFFHSCILDDDELALYAETGTSVAHCPVTNLRRGAVARVPEMLALGINVGLGVDLPNNDLFNVIRMTSRIHTVLPREPRGLPVWAPLEMATIGGARALNLEADIGTLEPGKKADIITLDLNRNTRLFPLTPQTVVNVIIDNGCGADVADLIVDGKILMRDRKLLHLDEEVILARAERWHREFICWYLDKLAKGEPLVERLHPDFHR